MSKRLQNIVWALSLVCAYPLYSFGQLYLFVLKQQDGDFYNMVNKYTGDWIKAHLILMLSLMLMVPAYVALCNYLEQTKGRLLVKISAFLVFLAAFSLFGQYTIDLVFAEVFRLPKDAAYKVLNDIQSNNVIKALFYDNSQLFFLLKYCDLTLASQVLLWVALLVSKKIPVWALVLFFMAILLTQLGLLIGPFYGRVIKRSGYILFSISLLPVAITILKANRVLSGKIAGSGSI